MPWLAVPERKRPPQCIGRNALPGRRPASRAAQAHSSPRRELTLTNPPSSQPSRKKSRGCSVILGSGSRANVSRGRPRGSPATRSPGAVHPAAVWPFLLIRRRPEPASGRPQYSRHRRARPLPVDRKRKSRANRFCLKNRRNQGKPHFTEAPARIRASICCVTVSLRPCSPLLKLSSQARSSHCEPMRRSTEWTATRCTSLRAG